MPAISSNRKQDLRIKSKPKKAFEQVAEITAEGTDSLAVTISAFSFDLNFHIPPSIWQRNNQPLEVFESGSFVPLGSGDSIKYFVSNPQYFYQLAINSNNNNCQIISLKNLGNVKLIFLSRLTKNSDNILTGIYPELGLLSAIDCALFNSLSDFNKGFPSLNSLRLDNDNLSSIGNIENLTKVSLWWFPKNNLAQSAIDELAEKLYLMSDLLPTRNKVLNVSEQTTGDSASGSLTDTITDGTGQGFLNGLVDDYGWTVIQ